MQLLVRGLLLFDHRLQVLLGRGQLLLETLGFLIGLTGAGRHGRHRFHPLGGLEQHQVVIAALLGRRLHRHNFDVDEVLTTVGRQAHALLANGLGAPFRAGQRAADGNQPS